MRVTLYLLRDGIEISQISLNKAERYQPAALRQSPEGVQWLLYVSQRPPAAVAWMKVLQPLLEESSSGLSMSGQSAGAVLLVAAHGRSFAVTFGTGFHAIKESDIEPDFGLKVVANSVDPDKLTRAETRGLEKGAKNSVSSLPVPNAVFALDLSTSEEWVRRFGGQMEDKSFAASASGADSLQLTMHGFTLDKLPDKLDQVLQRYLSDRYQKIFPFLDYFRRLPAKAPQVSTLDLQVANLFDLRSDELGFAAPHEFGFYDPDYYVFRSGHKKVDVPELTVEYVYPAIDEIGGWDSPLYRVRVDAVGRGGESLDLNTKLSQYVVANVSINTGPYKGNYTQTAGAWFKVDDKYSEQLERFIRDEVVDITEDIALLEWDEQKLIDDKVKGKYGEERYNNFVGGENGWAVLDRKFYTGSAGEKVEVCDLLSPDKQLICVKRMDGADAMSHLFQQGSISALLMFNTDYQAKVLKALSSVGGDGGAFGSAQDWTFVFGIATSKPGALRDSMTFFSKVALKTHQDEICSRGFKVAIARIQRNNYKAPAT